MFEGLLFAVVLAAALAPVLIKLSGRTLLPQTGARAVVALWLGLTVAILLAVVCTGPNAPDSATNRPRQIPTEGYVGSTSCRACHPHEHATWHDSYHRTMTQVASTESVIGNFDDVSLVDGVVSVLLQHAGDSFTAEITVKGQGRMGRFPMVMTTGSHHMQAYWFTKTETSRELWMLPFMYLKAEQRWIPRRAAFLKQLVGNDQGLKTLNIEKGRWNRICIKCHVTQGQPRPQFDAKGQFTELDTRAMEFGISCEACHGPGAEHVRVNSDPLHRYTNHLSDASDPTIVNPSKLSHDLASQACGQCHGASQILKGREAEMRWEDHGYDYRPGDDLSKSRMRFLMQPGCLSTTTIKDKMPVDAAPLDCWFWEDGMIRVSGREYNGLVESPCYTSKDPARSKVSCMSCHRMHQASDDPRTREQWTDDQLGRDKRSNSACVQCHSKFEDAALVASHTHHAAGSGGGLCYNCHMPHTTYGLMKAIRSHQVDSPSVKVSQETGRPNACNQCHLDQTLAWTAEHLSNWYGIAKPKLTKDEQEIAASVLWLLRGDAGQRALMAWSFGWDEALRASGSHWQAPYLAQLLEDPYDAVRFIAHRSLRRLPGFDSFRFEFMAPPEDRAVVGRSALAKWTQSVRPGTLALNRRVLLDPQGRVMQTVFRRLLKARNNRRVFLLE